MQNNLPQFYNIILKYDVDLQVFTQEGVAIFLEREKKSFGLHRIL